MAINKKLIHFNKKESFNTELANNNILNTSIVFIKDSKEIWTHGQLYATQLTVAEIEAIVANSPSVEDALAQIAAEVTARDKAVMAEKHRAEQAEATLSANIEAEITRSTVKDEAHTAAINKEIQDRINAIATEVTNRDAAIEVETNRALAAERTLQTNINSTNTAINDEVDRATEAEQLIQTNLTNEITRAKAAEQVLDSKITDHTNITDTALALKADKSDTYTKSQVDQKVSGLYKVKGSSTFEDLPKTNAVGDTYNITNSFTLNGVVYPAGTNIVYTGNGWDALSGVFDTTALEGSIQTVADNLTKESVRAKEAESALSTSIATEVADRKQADTTIQSNITTLTNKVNANEIKLSTIQGDYKTEGSINKALEDAKAYTNSVVSGLDSTITGSSKNVTVSVTEADGKLFNITVNQKDGNGSGLDADMLDGKQPSELNVASATKLETARTIWGQSFDGTGDVNGSLDVRGSVSGDFVDWYGVSWSENSSNPTCTRIGNMAMHRSLPIQSAMKGYVVGMAESQHPDGMIPLSDDWSCILFSSKNNNSPAYDNTFTGVNTMVKIPEFWYIDEYVPSTKTHNLKISQTAKAGWCHHKEAYVGAYEGWCDDTYYYSRRNQIPTVSVTRETLRTKARANGYNGESKWNIYTYEEHRAICHLFLVEYATRNCQAAVNGSLTAEGFRQGGLGSGCTTGTMNGAYSFIPTGTTDSLGNGSGQVAYTASNGTTYYANRYRGIENPFGHIWKHCDDVITQIVQSGYRTAYKCEDPSQFATNKNAKYKPLCSFASGLQGYKKEIKATINCDFFTESIGGSQSTYWCDHSYDNTDKSEHCLLIGGSSDNGSNAGLFRFHLHSGVGRFDVYIGSRLTYLPWAE